MNCSSFERWLDAGMPEDGSRGAIAHASGCRVCAPALEEARAVEAVLRAEASRAREGAVASAGFVDAVMARVELEGVGARRVEGAGPLGEDAPAPWWLRLFADPVSVVSVTLAVVVGSLALLRPEWFVAISAILSLRAGERLAAWAVLSHPSPAILAVAAAIAPLLAFSAVAVYRYFERALVLVVGERRR